MELYIYIIIFIFGSIMGSFLNVLAVRLSNNESIIYPRSHCHNCNHKLKWYELIPIISYIIQKGKSRCCHTRIPISYLIVEIVTGALYCTTYHSFGFSYELIISLIFISSLIVIIVSDIEYMIILDEVIAIASILIILLELIFFGLDYAVEKKAYCIIISGGRTVSPELNEKARRRGVCILISSFDTASTSMLATYATPVSSIAKAVFFIESFLSFDILAGS